MFPFLSHPQLAYLDGSLVTMARLSLVVPLTLLFLVLSLVNAESYPTTNYKLVKDFEAGTSNFFNNFNFYTGSDPTNGDVKYHHSFPTLLKLFSFM